MTTAQACCSSAIRDEFSAALAKVLADASNAIAAEPMTFIECGVRRLRRAGALRSCV
jgi:hypothetical protein